MASASDYCSTRRLEQLMRMMTTTGGYRVPPHGALLAEPVTGLQTYPVDIYNNAMAEDIPYPLTREEALSFLEDVLKIDDPEGFIVNDRLGFVDTFIHRMCTMIPFTNIPHVSRRIDAKGGISFEECKEAILQRHGGHCYYKNIFSKALLDVLGFSTFHVGGNNPGEELFDTHAAIIMRDLTSPGSLHLIEPGTRRPIFHAIPLDFEEESPAYKFSFITSKFFKQSHGRLVWCAYAPQETEPSENVLESEDGTFWKVQLTYWLNSPRNRAWFAKAGDARFGIPGLMPQLQQVVFLVGYKGNAMYSIGFYGQKDGMKQVAAMRVEHEDPSKCEVEILTAEEFTERVVELFPQFSREMVQRGVKNTILGANLFSM